MNTADFENIIKISFNHKQLLEQSLTHRSYLNESESAKSSNERLEFLGDAILSFVSSEFLYRQYPQLPEGMLTGIRSAIVKTKTLVSAAESISLGSYLLLSKGEEESGGRRNPSILADAFEALIAAVFLDQGFPTAGRFIEEHLLKNVDKIIGSKAYVDFKSKIQELVQEKYKKSPLYKVLKEEGPDHAKWFLVGLFVNQRKMSFGEGKSKQEAEQSAAAALIEKWGKIS